MSQWYIILIHWNETDLTIDQLLIVAVLNKMDTVSFLVMSGEMLQLVICIQYHELGEWALGTIGFILAGFCWKNWLKISWRLWWRNRESVNSKQ